MTETRQTFLDEVPESDLTVPRRRYFDDRPLSDYTASSREKFGLQRTGTVYRHSYLYQAEYPISGDSRDDYQQGTIELRARFWNRSRDLNDTLQGLLRATAHAAAYCFNSGVETSAYEGYLDGFNCVGASKRFESEQVGESGGSNAQVGKVDWNVEIYNEDGELSGIAQGVTNPWTSTTERLPGREPVDVAPHKWRLTFNDSRDQYDVHPEGNSRAKQRYRDGAGQGKTVHVNGRPIGSLDKNGRTWLTNEYGRGDPNTTSGAFGTYWSREGLVDETAATYQALRKGGVLYHVGETETGIYLRTRAALPDGYQAADADAVAPDVEAREGREPTTIHTLDVRTSTLPVECRRDETVIRHLGYSMPSWEHEVSRGWRV